MTSGSSSVFLFEVSSSSSSERGRFVEEEEVEGSWERRGVKKDWSERRASTTNCGGDEGEKEREVVDVSSR